MAEFISKIPTNLTEYPNSFKRQGAFPLEAYSVFTSVTEAEAYAKSNPLAYVGQVVAVTYKTTETIEEQTVTKEHARLYVIRTEAGALLELGSTESVNAGFDEIWAVLDHWAPFFEDKDSLDKAYDTLKELQAYIDEHGNDFLGLVSDVGENREDINHIYSRWELNEDGSYKRDENGDRIPKTAPTGKLQDEIDRAITAEKAIYDPEGGVDSEGNKIATGHLANEITRALVAEYAEAEARKEADTQIHGKIDALFKSTIVNGTKTYSGEIVEYIVDAVPIATLERLGRVKSSNEENYIKVQEDGTMEVNSLNVMKLTQTDGDLLILDGGNANGITPKS